MFYKEQIVAFSFFIFLAYSTSGVAGWFGDDYKFTPPATAEGKVCLAKCEEKQDSCSSAIKESNEKKQTDCENKAAQEKDACLKYSSDRTTCNKVSVCMPGFEGTSECEKKYRTCYQICGGTVEIIK